MFLQATEATLVFWYGLFTAVFWVVTSIYFNVNRRKIKFLLEMPVASQLPEPWVDIIIPVRNEEANLAAALASVCQLNYSNYRILVINDRSTDRTPAILAAFARQDARVTVIQVAELPPHWLGKNHALYQGYLAATAEWMLFTDADVAYAPDALRKAMHYTQQQHLDFLTILPEIKSRSGLLVGVISTFKIMLELKLKPWNTANPASDAYIGVGAFMLLKKSAYELAGTHLPIALRPDDDLKLAELVKKAGLQMDVLYGDQEIGLEWYPSLLAFTQGLMKNTFAVANYNVWVAAAGIMATLLAFVLPWPVLWWGGGPVERGLFGLIFLAQLMFFIPWKSFAVKWWHIFLLPLAGLIIVYIIFKSAYLTLKQGGIYWRDSFYSLTELRKNK